jgi:hypothetical protein
MKLQYCCRSLRVSSSLALAFNGIINCVTWELDFHKLSGVLALLLVV